MKPYHIRVETDPHLDGIELVVRAPEQNEDVETIVRQLSDSAPKTLLVFDRFDNRKLIRPEEIVLLSVEGKLLHIVTGNGSYYLKQTMRTIEELLDPESFVRISRFEIVNLSKVMSFDFTLAGTLRLELDGGMETWASRRCIPAIRKRLTGKE